MQIGANATNYANGIGALFTNLQVSLGTAAYQSVGYFQPASDILSNLVAINFSGQGVSYIESPDNILLKRTNGVEILRANDSGNSQFNFYDGNAAFIADNGGNITLEDHNGATRLYATAGGTTTIQSSSGNPGLTVNVNDTLQFYKSAKVFGVTMPATVSATLTNWIADVSNSGSSETHVNQITFPANFFVSDGDSITRTVGIKAAANGNGKTVKVYFDSTLAASASSSTSGAYFYVTVTLTRTSASTYRTMAQITTASGTTGTTGGSAFAYVNSVSMGSDFTNTKVCDLSLTGTSSTDLTVVLDRIEYKPAQ